MAPLLEPGAVFLDDVDVAQYGLVVARVDGWTGSPARTLPTVVVAGRSGVRVAGAATTGARALTLRGTVRGATAAAARANLDALRAACRGPARLRCADAPDRELVVYLAGVDAEDPDAGQLVAADLAVAVALVAPDPHKRARAEDAVPMPGGGPPNEAGLGTAPSRPRMELGAVASPVITVTDGAGAVRGVISLPGVTGNVVVDHDAGTIRDRDTGASRLAALTSASLFPLVLDPAAGAFRFASAGCGTAFAYYRRAYL